MVIIEADLYIVKIRFMAKGGEGMSIPVLLDLNGSLVLIVGGGPVAERKVTALLREGALVRVVSPAVTPGLRALAESGAIDLVERPYAPGDQAGALLVVACTGVPAVDRAVAAEAAREKRLVSVGSESSGGNLSFMAVVRRGPVTVALASDGASPALVVRLRREVEQAVGPEYGVLATLLQEVRQRVKEAPHLSQPERAALFTEIVQGPALALLAAGRETEARSQIARTLAQHLEHGGEG